MKKILALTMVVVLVLGLSLVSCESALDQTALDKLQEANDLMESAIDDFGPKTEEQLNATPSTPDKQIELLGGKTPIQKYDEVYEVLKNATNVTITAKQDIVMSFKANGQTQTQDMKQTIVQKYAGDNFSIVGSAESMGQSIPSVNAHYVDGMVYTVQVNNGYKFKYNATKDQLASKVGVDPDAPKIFDIPESWFLDVKFYEESNGDRAYMKFVLSGEQYMEMFSNLALLSSVQSMSNITHKVYFTANGDIDSVVTTASMVMHDPSLGEVNASFVSVSTFGDIGTTVVTAPADAGSYNLVDISMVG